MSPMVDLHHARREYAGQPIAGEGASPWPLFEQWFAEARQGEAAGELVAGDYRPALFIMVGLLVIGFIANLLVKPVAAKWHEPTSPPSPSTQEASAVR